MAADGSGRDLVLGTPRGGRLEAHPALAGVDTFRYLPRWGPGKKRVAGPGVRARLRRVYRRLGATAVIANTLESFQAVMAAADEGIPSVWMVHEFAENYRARREWGAIREAASAASCLVFNSDASRKQVSALGEGLESKACRVYPGIDPGLFPARSRPSPGPGFRIGCVGDICPAKNQLGLIELLAPLLREFPEAGLHLIGRVPAAFAAYGKEVEHRIGRLDAPAKVVLEGEKTDAPALIADLDLLINAAPHESFGLAVLEAMAAGVPVVAVDGGGPGELLGPLGAVVPPGDGPALQNAVSRAVAASAGERRMWAQAARARIEERFLLRDYAGNMLEILTRLTAAERRPRGGPDG